MKVHKNLLGTNNDKIHVDEIAVALDLLLGEAVIVEHGSNANGTYTKFGNGLMICYAEVTPDRSNKTTRQRFDTPAEFINKASTSVTHASGANEEYQLSCGTMLEAFEDSAWIVAFTNTTNIGASLPMYLSAVGRWK